MGRSPTVLKEKRQILACGEVETPRADIMTTSISRELQKDHLRERLNSYTRRAFQMLPELDNPSILDIGCGTGVPTMELARLSTGQIIGLDNNQPHLDELRRKIEDAGLSETVSRR